MKLITLALLLCTVQVAAQGISDLRYIRTNKTCGIAQMYMDEDMMIIGEDTIVINEVTKYITNFDKITSTTSTKYTFMELVDTKDRLYQITLTVWPLQKREEATVTDEKENIVYVISNYDICR